MRINSPTRGRVRTRPSVAPPLTPLLASRSSASWCVPSHISDTIYRVNLAAHTPSRACTCVRPSDNARVRGIGRLGIDIQRRRHGWAWKFQVCQVSIIDSGVGRCGCGEGDGTSRDDGLGRLGRNGEITSQQTEDRRPTEGSQPRKSGDTLDGWRGTGNEERGTSGNEHDQARLEQEGDPG
ncbi:hypothetical protein OG21DRAFT_565023 [Imleria badia]|nr:hypothetical protein OG21DRAFT_565023 [Imleria badia]